MLGITTAIFPRSGIPNSWDDTFCPPVGGECRTRFARRRKRAARRGQGRFPLDFVRRRHAPHACCRKTGLKTAGRGAIVGA